MPFLPRRCSPFAVFSSRIDFDLRSELPVVISAAFGLSLLEATLRLETSTTAASLTGTFSAIVEGQTQTTTQTAVGSWSGVRESVRISWDDGCEDELSIADGGATLIGESCLLFGVLMEFRR